MYSIEIFTNVNKISKIGLRDGPNNFLLFNFYIKSFSVKPLGKPCYWNNEIKFYTKKRIKRRMASRDERK